MSRLASAFAAARGSTGLVPFIVAGYPDFATSLALLRGFARQGVRAVEIGVPFSDPIADGPEIQRASERVLRNGDGSDQALALVEALRRESQMPIVLMSYLNPLLRPGFEAFLERARRSGLDGVLVSDLPPDEAPEIWDAIDRIELDSVVLVAPTTDERRLPALLARARGFVYCLARTGVTGAGSGYSGAIPERIESIRRRTDLPVAVGFGISSGHEAARLKGIADAVVVGAAFVRAVDTGSPEGATERVLALSGELIEALA